MCSSDLNKPVPDVVNAAERLAIYGVFITRPRHGDNAALIMALALRLDHGTRLDTRQNQEISIVSPEFCPQNSRIPHARATST